LLRVFLGPLPARGKLELSHKKLAKVIAVDGPPKLILFGEMVYVNDGRHGRLNFAMLNIKISMLDAETALEYYSQKALNRSLRTLRVLETTGQTAYPCNSRW
jgi:hypothetical protein